MSKYEVRGGFSANNIVARESIDEWYKKEIERNLMEKDPVMRGYNLLKLRLGGAESLGEIPVSGSDMLEIEKFPFAQISDLVPPQNHSQKILEIQASLTSDDKMKFESNLRTSEQEQVASILGISKKEAENFVGYMKGTVKTF